LTLLHFLAAIAQRDQYAFIKKDSDPICDIPVDTNNVCFRRQAAARKAQTAAQPAGCG
jgi:hypothetical protein